MMADLALLALLTAMLLPVLGNVIACCCETCDICSDDFNRSDDTDINTGSACGWTESSGSWAISSNQLVESSGSTNSLAICDTAHPDAESTMVVQVDFKHSNSGSSCDVIVGLVDASNYHYARFTVGTNAVLIRRVVAGSHSTLATRSVTLAINTTYTAKVCVTPSGSITASVNSVPKVSAHGTPLGSQSGLGATGAGTATFDDFTMTKAFNSDTCERCLVPCGGACCSGDTMPSSLTMVVQDITNGTCGSCTSLNATYVVDFTSEPIPTFSGGCVYIYQFPSPICTNPNDFNFAGAELLCDTDTGELYFVNAFVGRANDALQNHIRWQDATNLVLDGPADCSAITSSISSVIDVSSVCVGAGSSVSISA